MKTSRNLAMLNLLRSKIKIHVVCCGGDFIFLNQKNDAPPRLESRGLGRRSFFGCSRSNRTLKGAVFVKLLDITINNHPYCDNDKYCRNPRKIYAEHLQFIKQPYNSYHQENNCKCWESSF